MMKAEVTGNAIEVSVSSGEAVLLGISTVLVVILTVLAGWQVAFVALGLSLLGAAGVDAVQQADVKILGR